MSGSGETVGSGKLVEGRWERSVRKESEREMKGRRDENVQKEDEN